jgi:hypothetical protein
MLHHIIFIEYIETAQIITRQCLIVYINCEISILCLGQLLWLCTNNWRECGLKGVNVAADVRVKGEINLEATVIVGQLSHEKLRCIRNITYLVTNSFVGGIVYHIPCFGW